VAARLADVVTECFAEPLLVARELSYGKRVDVHHTQLLVGLNDSVADDAIVAVGTPRSIGASGLAVFARAATAHQTEHE
jgi:hypothetical protein